jgi:M6 family metalloprotease-like protein
MRKGFMYMKQIIKLLCVSASALLLTTGCSITFNNGSSETTAASTTSENTSNSESTSSEDSGTIKYAGQKITLEMVGGNDGVIYTKATGNQNIVVVPVLFSDITLNELQSASTTNNWDIDYSSTSKIKENINKVFFGDSSDTGWESISSYMNKSSYGKLNLTGEVTDVFTYNKTLKQFLNLTDSSDYADYYDRTWDVSEAATEFVKSQYSDYSTRFDNDNDGYIDGIWLVYLNPHYSLDGASDFYASQLGVSNSSYTSTYKEKIESTMWAYVYWNYRTLDIETPDFDPYVYGWASYAFAFEGYGSSALDGHTYIHETGHMLGLDDYYNYDGDDAPLGGIDMHDANIGDDNAYSKYLLNWITPQVINSKGTYTLKPFESTGESLLIPASNFNDSPFDEYLLLEYYTPTGLNEKDSSGYPGNGYSTFSLNGLKILHVDARLAKLNSSSGKFVEYSDTFYDDNNYYSVIGHSNTPSYNANNKDTNRLITLLSSTHGTSYYYYDETMYADNTDLFTKGKSLASTYKFHDGSSLGFKITVSDISDDEITITLS